jgi:hypothetical protein
MPWWRTSVHRQHLETNTKLMQWILFQHKANAVDFVSGIIVSQQLHKIATSGFVSSQWSLSFDLPVAVPVDNNNNNKNT